MTGTYLLNKIIEPFEVYPEEDAQNNFTFYGLGATSYLEDFKVSSENYANVAIFNKVGSGKVIKINRCDLEFLYNTYSGDATSGEAAKIVLIDSTDGGIDVPIVKLDSANTTITTLSVKEKSTSTILGTRILRTIKANSTDQPTLLTNLVVKIPNGTKSNTFLNTSNQSAIEKIKLREGEGIAIKGINSYLNYVLIIDVTINVISGGAGTYFVTKTAPINTEGDLLSIYNESGSGLIYEVISINITQRSIISLRGSVSFPHMPHFYLSPIKNIEDFTGEDIEPIKMDSNNSLSSNILIKKNCLVNYDLQTFLMHRPKLNWFIPTLQLAGSPILFFNTLPKNKLGSKNTFRTIELNEGEGIALMARLHMNSGILEFNMTFTETDAEAPPSSGGETGFAYA